MTRLAGPMAAAALLLGTGTASAAFIDFTASSMASGMAGGTTYSLSSSPGDTLNFAAAGAPGPIGGLQGANDGVGLNDDEIGNETNEYITVTFGRTVRLSSAYFLDLFADAQGGSAETAWVYTGSAPGGTPAASFDGTEAYAPGGFGFLQGSLSLTGTSFTFDAGEGNDGKGIGDFALAGLEFAVIPLPAAGLLLGTALCGLGFARRKSA